MRFTVVSSPMTIQTSREHGFFFFSLLYYWCSEQWLIQSKCPENIYQKIFENKRISTVGIHSKWMVQDIQKGRATFAGVNQMWRQRVNSHSHMAQKSSPSAALAP